jgi:hypothetical protein
MLRRGATDVELNPFAPRLTPRRTLRPDQGSPELQCRRTRTRGGSPRRPDPSSNTHSTIKGSHRGAKSAESAMAVLEIKGEHVERSPLDRLTKAVATSRRSLIHGCIGLAKPVGRSCLHSTGSPRDGDRAASPWHPVGWSPPRTLRAIPSWMTTWPILGEPGLHVRGQSWAAREKARSRRTRRLRVNFGWRGVPDAGGSSGKECRACVSWFRTHVGWATGLR